MTPNDPKRDSNLDKPHPEFETPLESGKECVTDADSVVEEVQEKVTSLDKFLANHTSEDNESFNEIEAEAEKKHRLKNAWMYKDER